VTLSPSERALLLALKRGKHFKANPAKAGDLLKMNSQDANPVGRRLIALELAARVMDSERPGALLLRITDAGISEAEKLEDAARSPTWRERLKAIPVGKGVWDILKIGLGAVIGILATKYFGK
jgi:hypothetical protein